MRKVVVALSALILAFSAANANSSSVYANMGLLEQGLTNIQKGFLYNSDAMIKSGVQNLVDAEDAISAKDRYDMAKAGMSEAAIENITASMREHIQQLDSAVEKKQMGEAANAYSNVVKDCVTCHIAIRDR